MVSPIINTVPLSHTFFWFFEPLGYVGNKCFRVVLVMLQSFFYRMEPSRIRRQHVDGWRLLLTSGFG
jgi:hypothetical protein